MCRMTGGDYRPNRAGTQGNSADCAHAGFPARFLVDCAPFRPSAGNHPNDTTMKNTILRPAFAAIAALLLCSCEHDEAKEKWEDVKEKTGLDKKEETDLTAAGVWSGHSGSGQWASVMTLSESNGRISGTMTWTPNDDTRGVSGTRSGKNVTLFIGGGDTWYLTLKGDRMTGTGDKAGTDKTYALSYVR